MPSQLYSSNQFLLSCSFFEEIVLFFFVLNILNDSIQYILKKLFFIFFQVEKAHSGDVHCVDWNPLDVNYILTGYEKRRLSSA
jgi:hypothetical protein